ncbi:MAG TPA: response regulator [Methanomassiliicoccales archaeon]|nr:response regulator [Methanomassiliicoccales archaeon]
MRPLKVLLVEDNRADACLVSDLVKQTGVATELTWLNDGQKAIDFLDSSNEIDLMLLDLKLPKMDGHQIADHITDDAKRKELPIIIMTGSTFQSDIDRLKEHIIVYLVKPMSIEEMDKTVVVLKEKLLLIWNANNVEVKE